MSTSRRALLSAAVMLPTTAAILGLTSGTAHAAGYSWPRTLSEGMTGDDVTQLQIRVSGYPGTGAVLGLDGTFGPATKAAVTRFQEAYGLPADGVAETATYDKIYSLQSADNTPVHFEYAELNKCNGDWSGGKVSPDAAKAAALVTMWKLEALRHALGDAAISVSSGFRSVACNDAVGGAGDSRHLYGDAADLTGSHSFCTLAKEARNRGFAGILGPGFPGHDDHVHLDARASQYWDAPSCGI